MRGLTFAEQCSWRDKGHELYYAAGIGIVHSPKRCERCQSPMLWDQPAQPKTGAARVTDPSTSHAAAEQVDAGKLEDRVVAFLDQHGPAICEEICAGTKEDWNTISPRLAPLRRAGRIRATGQLRKPENGGRAQLEWEAIL